MRDRLCRPPPQKKNQHARTHTLAHTHKHTHTHTHQDGPSAGLALAAALVSRLSGWGLPASTAMTGEVTLTGRVLPVGGVRDKVWY